MLNLIYKDLILQKKMVLFALGYSIFIHFAFQSPAFVDGAYIMGTIAIVYLFIMGACAYDDTYKSNVLFNSLPLGRSRIVLAKYASILVFTVIAFTVMGGAGALMKAVGLPFPIKYMSLTDILLVLVWLSLLGSLYMPVFFKFGYIRSRFFNVIAFLIFFFLPNIAIDILKDMTAAGEVPAIVTSFLAAPPWVIIMSVFMLVIVLWSLSLGLSLRIYARKEF